jgi:hypothetical protein
MPTDPKAGLRFATIGILLIATTVAHAQSYPERPITLIVPFAAGGAADTTGRIMADAMSRQLGKTIVMENVGRGPEARLAQGAVRPPLRMATQLVSAMRGRTLLPSPSTRSSLTTRARTSSIWAW